MTEPEIQAHKIRSPIQLLAVWFVTLIIIDGAFLSTAATINQPPWIGSMLSIASVLFVPVFLTAAIVMQTRYRAQLQEDAYYSEWQKQQEENLSQLRDQQQQQASDILDFNSILKRVDDQQKRLDFVTKSLVTKFGLETLRGLGAETPFLVRYHYDLINDLRRLDELGFIRPTAGHGIYPTQAFHGTDQAFDLKEYVELTQTGREWLEMYVKMDIMNNENS